jgi:hypothetical protein
MPHTLQSLKRMSMPSLSIFAKMLAGPSQYDHSSRICSAGQMLSQKIYDLPGGFHLSLPIADYYSTNHGRIEGFGVKPDIEVDAANALSVALRQ